MSDYSQMKFGEYEEVTAWAQYLDHDAACRILAEGFDSPMSGQPTDWRDCYTTEELREFAADKVARVCNVPS